MSHAEQYALNVTEDATKVQLVTINQGNFILFHRNLLHQGVSYKKEHLRVFAYVEIFPRGSEDVLTLADPGETSKYVSPRENSVVPLRAVEEPEKET